MHRKVYDIKVNRFSKLLSFALAAVLCYGQLVASAHFVEHLPSQSASNTGLTNHAGLHRIHSLSHRAKHASDQEAEHGIRHVDHLDTNGDRQAALPHSSSEHGDRSIADCSIYHFYSGLSGLVHARVDVPGTLFNHVTAAAYRAASQYSAIEYHQPIRAPPQFS